MDGFEKVCKSLENVESAVLAFSGGFDSSFLAEACALSVRNFHAVFVDMPVISERQRSDAKRIAEKLEIPLIVIELDWDSLTDMKSNDGMRCYHCKKAIYEEVKSVAKELEINTIFCGDNYDDLNVDRPGRIAASEAGVKSPLEELKITRDIVLNYVNKRPWSEGMVKGTCLATRIPEDVKLSDKLLEEIEEIEEMICRVAGISQVRFRHHGDYGVIQTYPEDIQKITDSMPELMSEFENKELSFRVDPEGYKDF